MWSHWISLEAAGGNMIIDLITLENYWQCLFKINSAGTSWVSSG